MTDTTHNLERQKFLKIDAATSSALVAFRPIVQQHVQPILQKFYSHITQQPHLREMLGGEAGVARARAAQAAHWLAIFEGKFDDAYVARVRRIGKTHERIGLEPRWYIGGYAIAMNELMAPSMRRSALMLR